MTWVSRSQWLAPVWSDQRAPGRSALKFVWFGADYPLVKSRHRFATSAIMIVAPLGLLCGTLMALGVPDAVDAGGVPGTVTGTVFRDYNSSGLDNTSATTADPAVDVGVGGAIVTAYDSGDIQVGTATSAADGTYTLGISGAASNAIRLEFTPPTGYFSGPIGTATSGDPIASGGPEQFVTLSGGAATGNYGADAPGDYCQSDPTVAVACLQGVLTNPASGSTGLTPVTNPALFTVPSLATGNVSATEVPQATLGQIGSTFGNAIYQSSPTQSYDFTSAFFHRFAALGPSGLGAIYLTTVEATQSGTPPDANTTLAATVPNVGTDPRGITEDPAPSSYGWFHNVAAYAAVDTIGLGGMALSPDQSTLYAVDLANSTLNVYPVIVAATAGGPPSLGTDTVYDLPTSLPGAAPGCAPANVQSFAVQSTATGALVGLTCTGPTQADLEGYIYTFTLAGGAFGSAPVLEIPFNGYNRGCVYPICVTPSTTPNDPTQTANWKPWSNTYPTSPPSPAGITEYPQPLVSAITVDSSGNMTVAVRDRTATVMLPLES